MKRWIICKSKKSNLPILQTLICRLFLFLLRQIGSEIVYTERNNVVVAFFHVRTALYFKSAKRDDYITVKIAWGGGSMVLDFSKISYTLFTKIPKTKNIYVKIINLWWFVSAVTGAASCIIYLFFRYKRWVGTRPAPEQNADKGPKDHHISADTQKGMCPSPDRGVR